MNRRRHLVIAAVATLLAATVPAHAWAQAPTSTSTASTNPTATTSGDSPYDDGATPSTTVTTDAAGNSEPTAPEPTGDAPGYTGGGQVIGDNPIREIRPNRFERPVMLHPDNGDDRTAERAEDAAQRAIAAADAATAAAAERSAANGALDQLGSDVMAARQRLDLDVTAEAEQRSIVGQLAVAFYVRGVELPDLATELMEPGHGNHRARDQVTTQSALEHHTAILRRAERTRQASSDELASLLASFPDARARLDAAQGAVARTDAAVVAARADAAALATQAERVKASVDQAAVDAVGSKGPVTFPIAGPWDYIDSWGYPRSGGRTHKGTDVFAPSGTPLVAIESGVVKPDADPLGGLVVFLVGDSGTNYYYAHLKDIAPDVLRAGDRGLEVAAGDLVGWVGNSGNAYDTPAHLHIQLASTGYAWENPYPLLRALAERVMSARARGAQPTVDLDLVEDLDVEELATLLGSGAALTPETEAALDRDIAERLLATGVLARPVVVTPLPELMARVPPAVGPAPDPSTYPTSTTAVTDSSDPNAPDAATAASAGSG